MQRSSASGILFFLVFSAACCMGQTVQNISAVFDNGKATITYDLVGFKAKELYYADLYASHDDFSKPLRFVSGEVGKDIKEGKGKTIEWRAAEETNGYRDPITFRIRLALLFQPLDFINPAWGSIRKGRTMQVMWQGGFISHEKELSLYRNGERVAVLGKMKGVWQYNWEIPASLPNGEYTLMLSGPNENASSNSFRIKPRVPLLVKLSPLLLAAAIIPFLDGNKDPGPSALPDAPLPE